MDGNCYRSFGPPPALGRTVFAALLCAWGLVPLGGSGEQLFGQDRALARFQYERSQSASAARPTVAPTAPRAVLRAPYRTPAQWQSGQRYRDSSPRHTATIDRRRPIDPAAYAAAPPDAAADSQGGAVHAEDLPLGGSDADSTYGPDFGPGIGIDDPGNYWEPVPGAGCECGPSSCACGGCDGGCGQCGGACGTSCRRPRKGFVASGWLAQGFTFNPQDPSDRFNGPVTFNDRANEYQLNQLYVVLEDCVDGCGNNWDLGGRVDLLYGTDYFFTTATGLEVHRDGSPRWNGDDGPRAGGATLYGLAMPQLYAEAYAPVGGGLWAKMGHFYSPVGYESVMYTANFFYSHSYIKQYGEPFTHTGLLAEYRLSPTWSVYSGFTQGWDAWDDINGQLGYLGGLAWCRPDCHETLRFFLHTGNEDDAGQNNRTAYSLVYTRLLSPCFAYAIEHNLGVEDNAATRGLRDVPALWYGIAQYFLCQVNCQTQAGVRAEWFRDEQNARVLGIPVRGSVGGNYVEVTAGANYRPAFMDRLEIRPELRWDWSDTQNESLGVGGMFDDFSKHYQVTIALSAAVSF